MSRFKVGGFFARFANLKKNWLGEVYIGKDFQGNKYYEIPEDSSRGIKLTRRVEATDPSPSTVPELPVEWMTWLQKGRGSPPTEEELLRNHLIKEQTLSRAKEVDQAWAEEKQRATTNILEDTTSKTSETDKVPFPKYDDYELQPGDSEYEPPEDAFYGSIKNKKTF